MEEESKAVYSYDEQGRFSEKLLLGSANREPRTLTKDGWKLGQWLIPANCTEVEPPEGKDGYDVIFNGETWELREIPKPPEPPEIPLDAIKQEKIDELKMIRDGKEVEPVTYGVHTFDYDDKSRDRLSIARQALTDAGGGGAILWTTADNQRVSLGVTDFAAINTAAANRSNALHIRYNELKSLVNAASTKEEVEAVIWDEAQV